MARTSRRLRLSSLAVAACATLATGCSAQPAAQTAVTPENEAVAAQQAAQQSVHPVSGLQIIPVTIVNDGEAHIFRTELADTPESQARGLMFRTELGPDEAMLFPSTRLEVRGFWMKNTPLPLDIIFIGEDGQIINIAANTVPYSLDSVYSDGPAAAVLELAGGRAGRIGHRAGR